MKNEHEEPRLFPDYEELIICGNRAGFVDLSEKVTELLEGESNEISLAGWQSENDFQGLQFKTAPEASYEPSSAKETFFTAVIVICFLVFLGVGSITTITWIFEKLF